MHWQDLVFTVGSLSFSVALLPMLRRGADRPPIFSSSLTSFWLIAYGVVFVTLSLVFSAITSIINGILWGTIAFLKWREPRVRKKRAREITDSWHLEDNEETEEIRQKLREQWARA